MSTQYYTASSLDGFIATPENSLDWLFQFTDVDESHYQNFLAEVGAIAMGSTTYEWILEHLLSPESKMHQPWPYQVPTWVFTTRELPPVEGADIRFVRGDVTPVHRDMAAVAGSKNIWIVGGGELVGQFHDAGFLDEVIVSIASVTLGSGAPLLPREIVTPPLKLLSAETFGHSFAVLHYQVQR
ncbi:dihydrofolate reductase family protein [Luteolibacter sp. GHJ8]|uniref:Dihydrofolate reductase family protein n=1 Tax=Luteolibacter rhizosphaerae TaxID=2989719 RepID=A0ABT3G1Q8_9BACT|nr:dihydrofolate reductase family protein [Luteolibacter rhizosphaerae]MCW1913767.1 dihydrofolate reductase family protein [Luteolibacter rhizosphaerae]